MVRFRSAWVAALVAAAAARGLADPPAPSGGPAAPSDDDLYDAARQLFNTYAPPEVKQQYDFPSRRQFDQFLAQLQAALQSGSLDQLAQYEPQARQALAVARTIPDYADYANWLEARLDELDEAREIVAAPAPPPPLPPRVIIPGPGPAVPPALPAPERIDSAIPYYARWYARVKDRPPPPQASRLMPTLEAAFAAEGVPPQLAWIAEAESSLDPNARSPAGARGLFQLEPATARSLGLSTFLPDQRTDPKASALAAAKELRRLGRRFGTWPLAIAAYNAGEGRVGRLLAQHHALSYAQIASALPGETRMYVPKVCALVAVRAGVPPNRLPPPG